MKLHNNKLRNNEWDGSLNKKTSGILDSFKNKLNKVTAKYDSLRYGLSYNEYRELSYHHLNVPKSFKKKND